MIIPEVYEQIVLKTLHINNFQNYVGLPVAQRLYIPLGIFHEQLKCTNLFT